MQQNYRNLGDLVRGDSLAKEYYVSLPDYVRGMVQQHTQSVNSFECLRNYAENLVEDGM